MKTKWHVFLAHSVEAVHVHVKLDIHGHNLESNKHHFRIQSTRA